MNAQLPGIESIQIPLWKQFILYLGTVGGVFLSSVLTGKSVDVSLLTIGQIVFSLFIAMMIIPSVFQKLNPNAPFIVQFGLFVQNGAFWHLLISSIHP